MPAAILVTERKNIGGLTNFLTTSLKKLCEFRGEILPIRWKNIMAI